MRIKVSRFDAVEGGAARIQEYEVPAAPDWTVMDVLDYIALHLDPTLAYYRHSTCDHGVCARCALKVDGAVALACTRQVGDAGELTLEPKPGSVVRDLIVK